MRTTIISVILVITSCHSPNQKTSIDPVLEFEKKISWQQEQEPMEYASFMKIFEEQFNGNNIEKIYTKIDVGLQANKDRHIAFLSDFREQNGAIKAARFKYFDKKYQRRNAEYLAVYSIELENSFWDLRTGLNDSLQLKRVILLDNNFNEDLPLIANKTIMHLPFEKQQEWFVLWGGEDDELNYHVTNQAQKNALDLLIKHPYSKKSFEKDGKTNEDFFAFGKNILSPCDGIVHKVIDGVKDNIPGETNPAQLTGNTVVIKTEFDEYVLLAHLQESSILVKEGNQLKTGTPIGKVGNSGNSTEPHLHLHMMDTPDLNNATGIKMLFDHLVVDGISTAQNYAPIKTNRIMNP